MGMGVGGFKVTAAAQVKANTEERVRRWRTKRDKNFSERRRETKQTLLSDSTAEETWDGRVLCASL